MSSIVQDGNVQPKNPDPADDDEDAVIKEAMEEYDHAQDGWAEVRNQGLDDLRFARDGDQWPLDIKQQRIFEKRPCLTINLMPLFIRQVVNDARQNKPAIKVRPVGSGADPQTADVISGIIKNIESSSDADVAYDTAATCAVQNGFGFFRINLDYACDDTFDLDLKFSPIPNPFAVLWDPNSEAYDSSDWDFCFVMDQIPRKEFEKLYPGIDFTSWGNDDKIRPWFNDDFVMRADYYKRTKSTRTIVQLSNGDIVDAETLQDPDFVQAATQLGIQPQQTRTVETYKVIHRQITAKNVLSKTIWPGDIIPVIPVYGDEYNVEGRRYFRSLIHYAKDSQKLFNVFRSLSTEVAGLQPKTPWIGPEEAFEGEDAEKWVNANTKNYAFLSYKGSTPPQRPAPIAPTEVPQAEALAAAQDMKQIIGISNPALGIPDNQVISGKAKRMERHESDTGVYHFADNLNRSIRCAGRILLQAIPRVYTTARIARILKDDNQPTQVAIGPRPQNGSPVQPPPGFDKVYDITQGKYDLVVDSGPSYTTRREEVAETLTTFVQAFPQAAPLVGDILAKVQDWPDAQKISKRLQTLLPPAIQAMEAGQPPPPPQPPPEVQAKMAQAQADIHISQQKAQSDIMINQQRAQNDAQIDQARLQAELVAERERAALQMQLEREKMAHQMMLDNQKFEHQKKLEELKTAATIIRQPGQQNPQQAIKEAGAS